VHVFQDAAAALRCDWWIMITQKTDKQDMNIKIIRADHSKVNTLFTGSRVTISKKSKSISVRSTKIWHILKLKSKSSTRRCDLLW